MTGAYGGSLEEVLGNGTLNVGASKNKKWFSTVFEY